MFEKLSIIIERKLYKILVDICTTNKINFTNWYFFVNDHKPNSGQIQTATKASGLQRENEPGT